MKKAHVLLTIALAAVMIFILPAKSKGQDDEKTCKHKHKHSDFNISGIKVIEEGEDTIVIYINKKDDKDISCTTNWSTFPFCSKKGKYNGHWAGVDFGWNGYVTKDFNMEFPPSEQYLNLNTARSLMVNLNPLELNVNIAANKFGFTSGLGFTLNNYYFSNSYTWISDSSALKAYNTVTDKGSTVSMKVNKLFVSYITLPLLFEFQTNPGHRVSSFHVTAGVIGGLRLQSYQKQRLYQWQDTYYLVDDKGTKVASFYANNAVIRNHNPYHLNPFKLDAALRIGWSYLNLFATYSITPMFQKNQGPEVYPWTIGITLLGW
ncbi:MAG: hypothetical protein V1733_08860 [bacterium]